MCRKRKTRKNCKAKIIKYIQANPHAISSEIKKFTGSCPHRFFGSLENAYSAAGIAYIPTRRTRADIKATIIKFIQENPKATVTEIHNEVGALPNRYFGTVERAFEVAGVKFPRRSKSINMQKEILDYIAVNPHASMRDASTDLKTNIYKHFKNYNEAREILSLPRAKTGREKDVKQREKILCYINQNPTPTQWEINKACKTQVQALFENGIEEAYWLAGITYPKHRRYKYGAANAHIHKRAREFEKKLNKHLINFGEIQKRTTGGVADAVIKLNGKPYVIEIKDYETKPITTTEAKQINRYMEALKIPNGIIICKNPQKRRRYDINNNKIEVMTVEEFMKFGDVAQFGSVPGSSD